MEILLAVVLLAVVTTVTYLGFSTVTVAWRRGMDLADKLHHGDFVVEQIVMALRSAYYPLGGVNGDYGFWFKEEGDGDGAVDEASWVKLGSALVGKDAPHAGGPHRIKLTLEEDPHGRRALAVRSWGLLAQVEDFDPDELEPTYITAEVTGLNYRFQDPESVTSTDPSGAAAASGATSISSDEIEWIDDWKDTNRIPRMVELTVYMAPLAKGDRPVEIKRIVELPLAPLAWK
ncbi:MAG: hypothetical protein K8T26_13750 [Lentisphaerae bacterium]|nr:hypothetical protein [Lentisphaerota bacterium]